MHAFALALGGRLVFGNGKTLASCYIKCNIRRLVSAWWAGKRDMTLMLAPDFHGQTVGT